MEIRRQVNIGYFLNYKQNTLMKSMPNVYENYWNSFYKYKLKYYKYVSYILIFKIGESVLTFYRHKIIYARQLRS